METVTKTADNTLTQKLEVTFLLCALGMQIKEIGETLIISDEDIETKKGRIEKYRQRIAHLYPNPDGTHSFELALSKAWYTGLMPLLIEKYRDKYRLLIEAFETEQKVKVVDMKGWIYNKEE